MPLQTEAVLEAQNKFDLPFEHETFVQFLVEAKKNTYASSTGDYKTKSLISGGHQLEYISGGFLYRDIYVGEGFFAGQEMVYHKGKPVWSMTYAGQIYNSASSEEINVVASHLFASLARVEHIAPYRGPTRFDNNDCCYTNQYRGLPQVTFRPFKKQNKNSNTSESMGRAKMHSRFLSLVLCPHIEAGFLEPSVQPIISWRAV